MSTSFNYDITNSSIFILILSIVLPIIVSYIFNKINSEREFYQKIKGSTRVEWIESMRKVISKFYECIYLILYDDTADSKTLAKLRNYAETIYLYCPKDGKKVEKYKKEKKKKTKIDNHDSNDLLNERVEEIYINVEKFYFNYKNVLSDSNESIEMDKKVLIDDINKKMNDFTIFVRNRFKIEWKKSKKAK